jgi:hypothetical protein
VEPTDRMSAHEVDLEFEELLASSVSQYELDMPEWALL